MLLFVVVIVDDDDDDDAIWVHFRHLNQFIILYGALRLSDILGSLFSVFFVAHKMFSAYYMHSNFCFRWFISFQR